ncbi:hypothetical protein HU200_046293 [Digitaria exilis]|uniref:Uncharacterized protein n=1 Tax=Digitaria exilis TaxID=1010633 RepID=A0A835AYK1_9POAL|nr:hypothetical protein HU200_046293 [Digitaria exilis]
MGPCAAVLRAEEGADRADAAAMGEGGWLVGGCAPTSCLGVARWDRSGNGGDEAILRCYRLVLSRELPWGISAFVSVHPWKYRAPE